MTESLKESGFLSTENGMYLCWSFYHLVLYFIALFISFSNSEENVPTVSTLSKHSRKVVEAVEILQTDNKELKIKVKQLEAEQSENKELKIKVKQLETVFAENTELKSKLVKLENDAEKNACLLHELKDAVNKLRNGMTNVEEVTRQVDLSKLVVRLILSEAYGIVENNELEDYEIPLRELTTSKWYSKVDCHFGGIEVALWRSNLALLERNETVDNSKRVLISSRILSSDNYKEETDLVVKSKRCYRVVIFMYEKTVEESSHLYFVYSSKSEEDFETNIFPHTWNNDFKKIENVEAEIKKFVPRLHNDGRPNERHDISQYNGGSVHFCKLPKFMQPERGETLYSSDLMWNAYKIGSGMNVTADACIILAKLVSHTLSEPPDIFQKMLGIENEEFDEKNECAILNAMERYTLFSRNDLADFRQLFESDTSCSIRRASAVIAQIMLELMDMSEISFLESEQPISEESKKMLESHLKSMQEGEIDIDYALAVGENEEVELIDVKVISLSEEDNIESGQSYVVERVKF